MTQIRKRSFRAASILAFSFGLLSSGGVYATAIADRSMPTCNIAEESRVMRDQRNRRLNRAVTWDRPWKLQNLNDVCIKIVTNAVVGFSPTVGTFGAWFYTPLAVVAINQVIKDVCGDIRSYYTNTWNRTVSRARGDILNTLTEAGEPGFYTRDDGGYTTPDDTPTTLPGYQCSDRIDNDGDGEIDFPADLGCTSLYDNSEGSGTEPPPPPPTPACSDGIDNDSDSRIDYPSDPGCLSAEDTSESGDPTPAQCQDSRDNDADGRTDFPDDPGCSGPSDDNETDDTPPVPLPACRDSRDNDLDGRIDFPTDTGCDSPDDNSESGESRTPQCSDGIDNDFDRRIDFPNDPDCLAPSQDTETYLYACQDGIDNDGDGRTDYPADSGCTFFTDDTEENPPALPSGVPLKPGVDPSSAKSSSVPSSAAPAQPSSRNSLNRPGALSKPAPLGPASTPSPAQPPARKN